MIQQINLYLPELRPQPDYLSTRNALIFIGVFFLLLLLGSVYATYRNAQLESEIASLEEHKHATEQKIAALDRKPVDQQKRELEYRITAAREALRNRQRLIEVLQGETLGNHEGFSAQIAALAELAPAGVALERFTVTAGGRDVRMVGKSRTTENIPLYLNMLRQHPAFEQSGFGELAIRRNAPWYEFTVNHSDDAETLVAPGGRSQ